MAATASIIIEVQDNATPAFQKLNAEAAKLSPTMQTTTRMSEQTFNNIEHGALKARESAALLGEEFGVKIPRALRGTIAEASLIGPIFTAAFSGMAAFGFAQIAVEAGNKISELVVKLLGWEEATKKMLELAAEANKSHLETAETLAKLQRQYELIGLSGLPKLSKGLQLAEEDLKGGSEEVDKLTARLAQLQKQATETTKVVTSVNRWGPHFEIVPTDTAKTAQGLIEGVRNELDAARDKVKILGQEVKDAGKAFDTTFAKDRAEEIKRIAEASEQAAARLQEMASAANRGGLTGIEQINADAQAQIVAVEKIFSKEPTLAAEASTAVTAISAEATRKRIAFYEAEYEKKSKLLEEFDAEDQRLEHERAERLRRMEGETVSMERQAAIAIAPPWARANATILADYQARMEKIREMQKTGDLDSEHAARQAAAAWTDAFAKMRDQLANDLETLFDNVTSGNIGKFFLTQFKHLVFQMVATWILGMQQMRGASQQQMGGGGGILGSIFGGIFGGGGGGGQGGVSSIPGVITNFGGGLLGPGGNGDFGGEVSGGGSGGLLASLGLSAGGGAASSGLGLPAGAGPGGAAGAGGAIGSLGGPLAGLLGKIFPHGAGGISGSTLGTLGIGLGIDGLIRGGWLGALETAGGGALTGFAIAGPIGALVGGIIGGIAGVVRWLFGGNKKKKQADALEAQLAVDIKTVMDSYDLFQTDYNGTISSLETLRTNYTAQFKKIGGIHRQIVESDALLNTAEEQVKATQAERNRRAGLAFGPAEFRVGGFVGPGLGGPAPAWFAGTAMHFAGGGAVPALLHEGEFVMRPEAVNRWGRGKLENMNSSGGGGDTHLHVTINAIDAKSFEGFLNRDGGVKILKFIQRAESQGMW